MQLRVMNDATGVIYLLIPEQQIRLEKDDDSARS